MLVTFHLEFLYKYLHSVLELFLWKKCIFLFSIWKREQNVSVLACVRALEFLSFLRERIFCLFFPGMLNRVSPFPRTVIGIPNDNQYKSDYFCKCFIFIAFELLIEIFLFFSFFCRRPCSLFLSLLSRLLKFYFFEFNHRLLKAINFLPITNMFIFQ